MDEHGENGPFIDYLPILSYISMQNTSIAMYQTTHFRPSEPGPPRPARLAFGWKFRHKLWRSSWVILG